MRLCDNPTPVFGGQADPQVAPLPLRVDSEEGLNVGFLDGLLMLPGQSGEQYDRRSPSGTDENLLPQGRAPAQPAGPPIQGGTVDRSKPSDLAAPRISHGQLNRPSDCVQMPPCLYGVSYRPVGLARSSLNSARRSGGIIW